MRKLKKKLPRGKRRRPFMNIAEELDGEEIPLQEWMIGSSGGAQ